MLDPIVARAVLFGVINCTDGELHFDEGMRAHQFLAAIVGEEGAFAVRKKGAQVATRHGVADAFKLALESLAHFHPDRETRLEIARQCLLAASADDLSRYEAAGVLKVLEVFGIASEDL